MRGLLKFLMMLVISSTSIVAFAQSSLLDSSFGSSGKIITHLGNFEDIGNSVAIQNNDKILIGGHTQNKSSNSYFALLRFNRNGTFDSSFGINGKVLTSIENQSRANSIAIQSDGKIIMGGYSQWYINLVRFNIDGSLDSSFGLNGKVIIDIIGYYSEQCKSLAIQNDGKILVGGFAAHNSNDNNYFLMLRFKTNGILDSTFGKEGIVIGNVGKCNSICIQSNDKILLSGSSGVGSSGFDFALMRYNLNGTIDNSFGNNGIVISKFANSGVNSESTSVCVQSDGKIIQAGYSFNNGIKSDFAIARLNIDGTLDVTFGIGGKVSTTVGNNSSRCNSLSLQNDGKLLLAGNAIKSSNYSDFALVRYKVNGELDSSFGTDGKIITSFGDSYTMCNSLGVHKDGRIVLGGYGFNGTKTFISLLRYNPDVKSVLSESKFKEKRINIFPNPSNNSFTIQFKFDYSNTSLFLYNSCGQVVDEISNISESEVQVYRNNLPNGLYILKLIKEGKIIYEEKLIINDY